MILADDINLLLQNLKQKVFKTTKNSVSYTWPGTSVSLNHHSLLAIPLYLKVVLSTPTSKWKDE